MERDVREAVVSVFHIGGCSVPLLSPPTVELLEDVVEPLPVVVVVVDAPDKSKASLVDAICDNSEAKSLRRSVGG